MMGLQPSFQWSWARGCRVPALKRSSSLPQDAYSKRFVPVACICRVAAIGDQKFEVITNNRTFAFRAESDGGSLGVCVYLCVSVCKYVCVCMYVYVCMCVNVCMCKYMCVSVCDVNICVRVYVSV